MRAVGVLLCVLALGCGDDDGVGDAGADAMGEDSGTVDAGDDDAGGEDAGESDAGADDAGTDAASDAGPPIDAGPPSERHVAVPLGTNDAGNGYWEYLPPRYADGNNPLLVFWHGLGENGDGVDDLDLVLRNGPPRLIDRDEWDGSLPFVVLSPQHSGGGCPNANEIRDFLAFAMDEYDVDDARIYLTGLSCGAIGSWNYLGQNTNDVVAAAVLIAGDGRNAFGRVGCELGNLAIWGFHGDLDTTVLPVGTIEPMEAIIECPDRRDARLTIYEGVAHNSWARTYDLSAGHDIYTWLLGETHTP